MNSTQFENVPVRFQKRVFPLELLNSETIKVKILIILSNLLFIIIKFLVFKKWLAVFWYIFISLFNARDSTKTPRAAQRQLKVN